MDTEHSRAPVRVTLALACVALVGACTMGPNFTRPETTPPTAFPATAASSPDVGSKAVARAYDGRQWWSVFKDPVLDRLVDEAQRQNLDLQTAALRIEEARAQRGTAVAQGRPSVSGMGVGGRQRSSENGFTSALGGGASSSSDPAAAAAAAPSPYSGPVPGGLRRDLGARPVGQGAPRRRGRGRQHRVGRTGARQRAHLADGRGRAHLPHAARRAAPARDRDGRHRRPAATARVDRIAHAQRLFRQGRQRAAAGPAVVVRVAAAAHRPEHRAGHEPPRAAARAAAGRAGRSPRARAAGRRRAATRGARGACPATCCGAGPTSSRARPTCTPPPPRSARPRRSCSRRFTLGGVGGLQSIHADSLTDWASRFWIGGAQISIPIFEGGKLKAQIRTADAQMKEAALTWRSTVLGRVPRGRQRAGGLRRRATPRRRAGPPARRRAARRRADALAPTQRVRVDDRGAGRAAQRAPGGAAGVAEQCLGVDGSCRVVQGAGG